MFEERDSDVLTIRAQENDEMVWFKQLDQEEL
jgi:hypothetical protein